MGRQVREHYYEWDILYIKCAHCKEIKPAEAFHKNKRDKFWIDNHCKECEKKRKIKMFSNETYREKDKEAHKRYRENNKEKISEYRKAYVKSHKKEWREYGQKYRQEHPDMTKENYLKNKEIIKKRNKDWHEKKEKETWIDISKFHAKARTYSKSRGLNPMYCVLCDKEGVVEMHHPSYNSFDKRKEVVFLCKSCHHLVHSGELGCPSPVDLIQLNAHMPVILTDKDLEYATV